MTTAPLRAGAAVRLLRALVLTAVVAGFGAGTHVAAGGLLPAPAVLLVLAAGLTLLHAAALAGPASTRRLVLLVAGGQAAVHVVLTALAGHRGQGTGGPLTASEGMAAAALPTSTLADAGARRGSLRDLYEVTTPGAGGDATTSATPAWLDDVVGHVVADLTGPHALMAIAHLVAAAGVALWLAAGERALWSLVCLLGTTAVAVLAMLVAFARLHGRPALVPVHRPRPRTRPRAALPAPLLGALARRGPPVVALA
ncbi:hypothetical protein [Nocardioides nanhaiensis]|uniref:Integral membrane protein n=1 Tax=Nocardioides nanhaiensis TaxID=1476871 RepID=A0ABP8WYS5_9ACTN